MFYEKSDLIQLYNQRLSGHMIHKDTEYLNGCVSASIKRAINEVKKELAKTNDWYDRKELWQKYEELQDRYAEECDSVIYRTDWYKELKEKNPEGVNLNKLYKSAKTDIEKDAVVNMYARHFCGVMPMYAHPVINYNEKHKGMSIISNFSDKDFKTMVEAVSDYAIREARDEKAGNGDMVYGAIANLSQTLKEDAYTILTSNRATEVLKEYNCLREDFLKVLDAKEGAQHKSYADDILNDTEYHEITTNIDDESLVKV